MFEIYTYICVLSGQMRENKMTNNDTIIERRVGRILVGFLFEQVTKLVHIAILTDYKEA